MLLLTGRRKSITIGVSNGLGLLFVNIVIVVVFLKVGVVVVVVDLVAARS